MKYLKTYNEDTNSEYYTKISQEEFRSNDTLPFSNFEIISQKEEDFLKKRYDTENIYKAETGKCIIFYFKKKLQNIRISIWRYQDEWYYVSINSGSYYKCDQWAGLIKLIDYYYNSK